jgi:hypothetical protein
MTDWRARGRVAYALKTGALIRAKACEQCKREGKLQAHGPSPRQLCALESTRDRFGFLLDYLQEHPRRSFRLAPMLLPIAERAGLDTETRGELLL